MTAVGVGCLSVDLLMVGQAMALFRPVHLVHLVPTMYSFVLYRPWLDHQIKLFQKGSSPVMCDV